MAITPWPAALLCLASCWEEQIVQITKVPHMAAVARMKSGRRPIWKEKKKHQSLVMMHKLGGKTYTINHQSTGDGNNEREDCKPAVETELGVCVGDSDTIVDIGLIVVG